MKNIIIVALLLLGYTQSQAKCDANADKLVREYSQVAKCKNNKIIWRDGTSMIYDDDKKETFDKILKHADIEDSFTHSYRKGPYKNPSKNYDPGRYRNDKFFRKMYGNSASAVKKRLTTINWFGQKIRVTTVNNVDKKLKAIARDLAKKVKKNPKLKKYLTPIGGTFKWRKIAGTNRLSVHSFGAAIDISVKYSAYWRWNKGAYKYQNKIPLEIFEIFEEHGFIWGGKWYHYDTMHFEYRPELL